MRLRSRINSMYEHATAVHAGAWAAFYEHVFRWLTDDELEAIVDALGLDNEALQEIEEMHAAFPTSAAWRQWSGKDKRDPMIIRAMVHAISQGTTAYAKLFEAAELEARIEVLEAQAKIQPIRRVA